MQLEEKIENIVLRLPELPKPPRKNLFQILGIQSKETLNSRILSYFLNPKEDHEFGYLFFESLLELYTEKSGQVPERVTKSFKVYTESSTSRVKRSEQKYKSIDISIDGKNNEWCVIIENKLNHILNNPLDIYWDHKKEDFSEIIGLIISLYPIHEKDCTTLKGRKYYNITHRELMNKVQSNLVLDGTLSHTSIIYLHEYFNNIQSHCRNETEAKPMNEIIRALMKQGPEVIQINEKLEEAVKYIDSSVDEIFQKYDYERSSYHFIYPQTNYQLRFWVNGGNEIILKNELRFVFESYGETDKLVRVNEKDFFDSLKDSVKDNKFFIFGNQDNNKSRTHLVKYANQNFLGDEEVFSEKFESLLEEYFLGYNGIVSIIENYMDSINE